MPKKPSAQKKPTSRSVRPSARETTAANRTWTGIEEHFDHGFGDYLRRLLVTRKQWQQAGEVQRVVATTAFELVGALGEAVQLQFRDGYTPFVDDVLRESARRFLLEFAAIYERQSRGRSFFGAQLNRRWVLFYALYTLPAVEAALEVAVRSARKNLPNTIPTLEATITASFGDPWKMSEVQLRAIPPSSKKRSLTVELLLEARGLRAIAQDIAATRFGVNIDDIKKGEPRHRTAKKTTE